MIILTKVVLVMMISLMFSIVLGIILIPVLKKHKADQRLSEYLEEEHTNHNEEGAKRLKEVGYKYWQEVKYHGLINIDYHSDYLDILNEADMQIDKFGNDVGFDKRLEDIKCRYGEESNVYNTVKVLVSKLRAK